MRGLSLKQARERAGALTRRYREGLTDLRERIAEEKARQDAEEATRRAKESAEQGTLRQLFIDGYVVGHLERHGCRLSAHHQFQ